ncbi:MAG: M48 family metallopeptidase, partial [Leptospiraceae bacterium]|nr:M48 family metallopeptidase [Leptospiraceae bacterium]
MRKVLLLILICSISILVFFLYQQEKNTVMESTLAPFYQILGKPILMADKVLNKTIPVNNADEKKYGESIKLRFSYLRDGSDQYKYLNSLIKELSKNSKKPFQYEVFLLDSYSPNAFATPGGTIFVTKGLLEILKSESELVSILGHELGHVEKGHCFDMVKFELLAKKLGMETLGKLADFIFAFAIKTSYNKTQEDEADEYGYNLIIESKYNPLSTGIAFNRLSQTYSDLESRKAN